MSVLTKRQEDFCIAYVETGSSSQAYRASYSTDNMKDNTISVKGSRMLKMDKIRLKIAELRTTMSKDALYTIEESIKGDLKIIEQYEELLAADISKLDKEELALHRYQLMSVVTHSHFNGAKERIAKMLGFYEKDNRQKVSLEYIRVGYTKPDKL